jgi:hypothetical protein
MDVVCSLDADAVAASADLQTVAKELDILPLQKHNNKSQI